MSAAPTLPKTIASRYQPIRLIGKGGMGVVYEVVHTRTGEHLALKVLQSSAGGSPEALERFKREARAPAQIRSENVVHVSDADVAPELDDSPFLVMELLDGMDLEQAARESKLAPAVVVGWLRQIAPALDKAHRLGIVHRDLKPENLFLAKLEDRTPIVKILDFGIAKMAAEGSVSTISGQVLGTPKYMAPEQATRHGHVSPATDRYALGLIAYRLIVGESYYRGDVMSILGELLHGTLSAPSARDESLGAAFDAWFLKACHREPQHRFASATEQVEALAQALGHGLGSADTLRDTSPSAAPGAEGDSKSAALPSWKRRSRLAITAGLLLVAALAFSLQYGGPKPEPLTASSASSAPAPPRAAEQPVSAPEPRAAAPRATLEASAELLPAPSAAPRSSAPSRALARRAATSGEAREAPKVSARDPFEDQK